MKITKPGFAGTILGVGLMFTRPDSLCAADAAKMAACTRQMEQLGQALQKYERERGHWPDQLSDLYPKYVSDRALFHCPADPTAGSPGRDYAHKDPIMPVSYSYDLNTDESNGLPTPQGKFPKPDRGNAWGSNRNVTLGQRAFFGDQVPILRCFHHKPEDADEETVLNLSLPGKIYASGVEWEDHPDTVVVALDLMAQDLLLKPDEFREKRYLGGFEVYTSGWEKDKRVRARAHDQLCRVAERLRSYSAKIDPKEQPYALRVAARLLNAAGEFQRAIEVVQEWGQAFQHARQQGDTEEGHDPTREAGVMILVDAHDGLKQFDQSIALLKAQLAIEHKQFYMRRLAQAYEAKGDKAEAELWWLKAEPGRGLIGRPAPDFTLPTAEGKTVSLQEVCRGKKTVLVNFWFYGCHPCRMEFPHLQEIYTKLKDHGFGLISVNYGDSATVVQKFIREKGWSFPIVLGGSKDNYIGNTYRVQAYPSNFLLDHDGKIIWRSEGFEEQELLQALARLGLPISGTDHSG
jgi:peroxiredoxin